MRLVTTWFGTFIVDDEGQIVDKTLFPKDSGEIAKRLEAIDRGEVLAEEEELAGGRELDVSEKRLELLGAFSGSESPDIKPEDFDYSMSLLNKAMLSRGRAKVKGSATPDQQIVQAIRAVDDLTKIINLMSERLHEWHELNFPELTEMVPEGEYVELIAQFGDRDGMIDAGKVKIEDSLGTDISQEDAEAMKLLAANLQATIKRRNEMEKFIEARMGQVAKNTSHLAGPLIGARLISLTGGLDRLSKVPSSTIQLLGAEKALFKHLKDNAKPPKHGVIFQHPMVHRAPPWQRGKIARAFAAKISIAVKMDRYGKDFIGPELEKQLNKRVEDIKKRYPKPKPGKKAKKKK